MSLLNRGTRLGLFLLILSFCQSGAARGADPTEIQIPRGASYLSGHFFRAHGEGRLPIAIILHGIPGGEGDVLGLGNRLSDVGINVLTFNYSGTYESGGEWTMANDSLDVASVYDYVRRPEIVARYFVDVARVYLGGYSHGGGVALLFAAAHPEVKHVFSIGGNDFGEWARRNARDPAFAEAIDGMFQGFVTQGWMRIANGADQELPDNVDKYDVKKRAQQLATKQLFLVGGLNDRTTPIEEFVLPLYRALQHNGADRVRFVAYQTDHSFSNVRDQIADELIDWIRSSE